MAECPNCGATLDQSASAFEMYQPPEPPQQPQPPQQQSYIPGGLFNASSLPPQQTSASGDPAGRPLGSLQRRLQRSQMSMPGDDESESEYNDYGSAAPPSGSRSRRSRSSDGWGARGAYPDAYPDERSRAGRYDERPGARYDERHDDRRGSRRGQQSSGYEGADGYSERGAHDDDFGARGRRSQSRPRRPYDDAPGGALDESREERAYSPYPAYNPDRDAHTARDDRGRSGWDSDSREAPAPRPRRPSGRRAPEPVAPFDDSGALSQEMSAEMSANQPAYRPAPRGGMESPRRDDERAPRGRSQGGERRSRASGPAGPRRPSSGRRPDGDDFTNPLDDPRAPAALRRPRGPSQGRSPYGPQGAPDGYDGYGEYGESGGNGGYGGYGARAGERARASRPQSPRGGYPEARRMDGPGYGSGYGPGYDTSYEEGYAGGGYTAGYGAGYDRGDAEYGVFPPELDGPDYNAAYSGGARDARDAQALAPVGMGGAPTAASGRGAARASGGASRKRRGGGLRVALLLLLTLVVVAGVGVVYGPKAYHLLKARTGGAPGVGPTSASTTCAAQQTPNPQQTPTSGYTTFATTAYTLQYPTGWQQTAQTGTGGGQCDAVYLFAQGAGVDKFIVEQSATFGPATDTQVIQSETQSAQSQGSSFSEITSAATTQSIGGEEWQRREYQVTNKTGAKLHVAILAGHHNGAGFAIMLISGDASFSKDDTTTFEPMLRAFQFV